MLATVSGRYVQADKAEELPEILVGLISARANEWSSPCPSYRPRADSTHGLRGDVGSLSVTSNLSSSMPISAYGDAGSAAFSQRARATSPRVYLAI